MCESDCRYVDDDALYDYYASPTCHLAELTSASEMTYIVSGGALNSTQTKPAFTPTTLALDSATPDGCQLSTTTTSR